MCESPDNGSKDPTAIQRETGDQIEESQGTVYIGQVPGNGQERAKCAHQRLQQAKENGQGKTRNGTGNGNPEFCDCAGWFGPDLGNAAKDEERDAADGDFVVQGHH